jgi:hypothetical protein
MEKLKPISLELSEGMKQFLEHKKFIDELFIATQQKFMKEFNEINK